MNSKAVPYFPRQLPGDEIIFPSEEVVWHILSLENIPRQKSLKDVISDLYDYQLSILFRKLWKGPTKKFTEHFGLDIENFAGYLGGRIKNSKNRFAIIKFLLRSEDHIDIRPVNEDNPKFVSYMSIPDLAQQIMSCSSITTICFIDGDNCPSVLNQILGLDNIFVICYMLLDRVTEHTRLWEDSKRFVLRYSRTYSKEASDIRISTDGPMLSSRLPSTFHFCFITSDLFVGELVEVMRRDCERSSVSIDPTFRKTALALALLDDPEIKKFSTSSPLEKSARSIKDIASAAVPSTLSSKGTNLFWQGNSFLLEQIQSTDSLDLMVELAHLFLPEDFLYVFDKRIQDMSSEELKFQWKLHWRGQRTQFCANYHLNRNEFFAFFSGVSSSNSEEAIRKFLNSKRRCDLT